MFHQKVASVSTPIESEDDITTDEEEPIPLTCKITKQNTEKNENKETRKK